MAWIGRGVVAMGSSRTGSVILSKTQRAVDLEDEPFTKVERIKKRTRQEDPSDVDTPVALSPKKPLFRKPLVSEPGVLEEDRKAYKTRMVAMRKELPKIGELIEGLNSQGDPVPGTLIYEEGRNGRNVMLGKVAVLACYPDLKRYLRPDPDGPGLRCIVDTPSIEESARLLGPLQFGQVVRVKQVRIEKVAPSGKSVIVSITRFE